MSEDTYSHDGPICPYCLHFHRPDDPVFYDEQNYTDEECYNCGKQFRVMVQHYTTWSCSPRGDEK